MCTVKTATAPPRLLAKATSLRDLSLHSCGLHDEGLIALASSMPSLERLAVQGDTIGEAGVRALVSSKHLEKLAAVHGLLEGSTKASADLEGALRERFRDVR